MALSLSNLFQQAKNKVASVKESVTNLFQQQAENKRRQDEEYRRKIEQAKTKIAQVKSDVGSFVQKAATKVGNTPLGYTEGGGLFEGPTRLPGGATMPPAGEQVRVKELFTSKGGKLAASTLSTAMGGALMSGGSLGGAGGAKTLTERAITGLKTGGLFAGVEAGLQKLRGEPIQPGGIAQAGLFGVVAGFAAPKIMEGVPKTQIAKDRTFLKQYGFELKDYENPAILKSKLRKTMVKIHPDKGGDPTKFKAFLEAYRNLTSAEAPAEAISTYDGMVNWAKDLWKKTTEKPAKPTTGREIIPSEVGGVTSPTAPMTPIVPLPSPNNNIPVVRYSTEKTVSTDSFRGGTWFATPESKTFDFTKQQGIGGKLRIETSIPINSPLVIKGANLEDGSFAVINEGFEKYVPPLQRKLANDLWNKVHLPEDLPKESEINKIITKILTKNGNTPDQINTVVQSENKMDAAMDLIISKGLKQNGIDSLILTNEHKGNEIDRHIFKFGEELTPLVEPTPAEKPVKSSIAPFEEEPHPGGPKTTLLPPIQPFDRVVKPPRTTIAKVEREFTQEKFKALLVAADTQEKYVKTVDSLTATIDKPEVANNKKKIRQVRALAVEEIKKMTGFELTNSWKYNWSLLQSIKEDPTISDSVKSLENLILKIDSKTSRRVALQIQQIQRDLHLPAEGKFFIPYGKYSTHGTGNREWVQQNIPLIRMGNKRGMLGYILDVLGIQQKDLGSITPSDVAHLSEVKNVVDTFGGSGLMSNLSRKFFPGSHITYNELDPGVFKAIDMAKADPKKLSGYVAQVGKYLAEKPGADWLAHFKTVYKEDKDFRTAASLIEAVGGRTGEITAGKMENLLQAIPHFGKTFTNIKTSSVDALGLIDHYIANGKPSDFLWIDPPYLWSSGYGVGSEMEQAEGFVKLLGKLGKLDERGVPFVFFNNDPEVQVEKAGREAIHLENIVRRMNKLSEDGLTIVRGINPIGAAKRREIIITNLPYGQEAGRLLNLAEVEKAIKSLKDDPAAAPKELLKLYRNIRDSSEFAPKGEAIRPAQIAEIKALRGALRIKTAELIPVMDELLGDVNFAKMTEVDGDHLIDWLQPRNWDVIESKIDLTRQMNEEEKRQRLIGDRFVAKDTVLEEKYGSVALMNKTVSDVENLVGMLRNLPRPQKMNPGLLRNVLSGAGRYLSEDLASSLLGIKATFHTPMRRIIDISSNHAERMKIAVSSPLKDLSVEERKQVMFLQAGAEHFYKGKITPAAHAVANYIQELSEANIGLINRIRVAKGQKPIVAKKPYIPWIIEENLGMAANLFGGNRFWQARTKTPRDFAVGLFEHDPARVIDIWSQSSASWIKKHLYGALMTQRFEDVYKVSDPAGAYAREIAMLDIYDMLPDGEKFSRSIGAAINKNLGSIWPKRIRVDEGLAKSILNTTFGQELRESINNGYLEVPRFELPSLVNVFHRVFYPLKLSWNFSFALLNLQQPTGAIPFIGLPSHAASVFRTLSSFLPWNRAIRMKYTKALEESGYQFGRYISGNQLPQTKAVIRFKESWPLIGGKEANVGAFIDHSINFLASTTELVNRLENEFGFDYYLTTHVEPKLKIKLSEQDKLRMAAKFSAYINFLSGKGYAPVAQRTSLGRFLYTFQQYPVNMINVYSDMAKVSFKDKGAAEFMKMIGAEAGITPEILERFDELPNKSKANVFNIFLALAIPVAVLYALSRSWNVAARALPGLPRISLSDLTDALFRWMNDPTNEDNKSLVADQISKSFQPTATARLKDYFDIVNYGMITTAGGKPVFVDQNARNAFNVFIFGRSALPEYNKAYPSFLSKYLGGQTDADKVKALADERRRIQREETKTAIEVTKKIIGKNISSDAIEAYLLRLAKDDKLTDAVKDKVRGFLKDYALGVDPFEAAVKDLNDIDQAAFILNMIKDPGLSTDEVQKRLDSYTKNGILTPNVKKKMEESLKTEGVVAADVGGQVAGAEAPGEGLFATKSPLDATTVASVIRVAPEKGRGGLESNATLIANALQEEGIYSPRIMAYALATIEHETADTFYPIREINGENNTRRFGYRGGSNYYGRGFIQLTHDYNYKKYGERLGMGNKLVENPDLALDPAISARILAAYFKDQGTAETAQRSFLAARASINPDRQARAIAIRANAYLKVL